MTEEIENQKIEVLTLYVRAQDELYSLAFTGECKLLESIETLKQARALHQKYNPERKEKWDEDDEYMRANCRLLYSQITRTPYRHTFTGKRHMWATLLKSE